MRTWRCGTCSTAAKKETFHVDKGRPGCQECGYYEARVTKEEPNDRPA